MRKVRTDLHIHTRASDGTLTPEELIKEIKEKNIELFSVTDHDSIGSIEEVRRLAQENNIKFIHGVEISSLLEGEQFHILAYNFDMKNQEFKNLIENNEKLLMKKDDDSIKMLIDHGFDLNYNEYLKYEHNPARGGWKTLNFLKDKGICNGVEEFFGKIFTGDRALKYPKFPHPKKVIEIIKNAQGIAVLAHPKYGKSKFKLEDILNWFTEWGIDGIECSHPNHDNETMELLMKYCNNNNLLITGGSDYHGGLISKRSLGNPEFYALENLLDK